MPITDTPSTAPNEAYWWRHSRVFRLDQGYTEPYAGGERWYAWFWEPYRFSAWAYELVRCIYKCKHHRLSATDLQLVQSLPRYDRLTENQKECLRLAFAPYVERPNVILNPRGVTLFQTGYSQPLPPLCVDLVETNKDQLFKLLTGFIEQERARLGVSRKKGPKDAERRNVRQTEKITDWKLVELLDAPFSQAQKDSRRRALKHARQWAPIVLNAWRIAPSINLFLMGVILSSTVFFNWRSASK